MPAAEYLPDWNRHALLTCAEMRKAEEISCAQGLLDFYGLMQKAGHAVANIVKERGPRCRVAVMCGPGNNGGDGYVAAEALRRAGWPVEVGVLRSGNLTSDAVRASASYQGKIRPLDAKLFDEADVVVDALFGTGLQRPLEGDVAQIIENLNARCLPVIAADFPSGVDGDTGRILGAAVQVQVTVTFFRKKLGHVLLPRAAQCGEVIVVDTGMDDSVLDEIKPAVAENSPDLWLNRFPLPHPDDHKYSRGHVLVYGGPVMTGAARLAARAAQRIGAGMVTLAAPESAMLLYAAALESVLVRQAETPDEWRALLDDAKKKAVLIGPGAGLGEATKNFVLEALRTRKPCVLDGDALTLFAETPGALFKALHPECVLTPHEGEFARLFGTSIEGGLDKLSRARKAATLAGCVLLLKGADTVIASPEGLAVINHNAPPWLATAGSGDVLAGMILGLLSPGMPPLAAAAAAAYLHGEIANKFGPGLIAEDLVAGIPAMLKDLLLS